MLQDSPNRREYVAKEGKYKDFTVDLKPYAKDPELQKRYMERMKKDSYAAPVNYYHSLKDNHNLEDESTFSEEDKKITVPLLYIGQTGDWVRLLPCTQQQHTDQSLS